MADAVEGFKALKLFASFTATGSSATTRRALSEGLSIGWVRHDEEARSTWLGHPEANATPTATSCMPAGSMKVSVMLRVWTWPDDV
jgi:hypothetical protein